MPHLRHHSHDDTTGTPHNPLPNTEARSTLSLAALFLFSLLFSGCASMSGSTDPHDPFEGYNRAVYQFNQDFDEAYGKPIAKAYEKVVPSAINKGITNFFSNLYDVTVLANDLLQLKFAQAAQDSMRIFFNTTVGILGIFDVATFMELRRHNEDFGQTLGYWGVPPGPYFVLPFIGPSTIRDSAGLAVDWTYFDPVFNQRVAVRNSLIVVNFVDTRADLLSASRLLEAAALDPYVFTREAYLQRRRNLVYDGDPPPEKYEDFEDSEAQSDADGALGQTR